MLSKINIKKTIYISIGCVLLIFFSIVAILQLYLGDKEVKTVSGTIEQLKQNTNIIEKVYLEWWNSSLNKISSQGVKDTYELKNTYKSLNIIVDNKDVLRDVILNEIIINGIPLIDYKYEVVESKDGKSIFKIPLNYLSENNTNKLTKTITVYNRYDDVFYKVNIDSFEFRFNFSKDNDFLYLGFENYISSFFDKEFKVETNYFSDNDQNFIYSFGHSTKNIKLPLINDLKISLDKDNSNLFFRENTTFTIYNRFDIPFITIGVTDSGDLRVINTYNLSNVYDVELKDQFFVFDSNEDNIFKITKNNDGTVDIQNLIDNYKIYFNEDTMKTYRIYDEDEKKDNKLVKFKIYRDLRDGSYIFAPNLSIELYRFYNFKENKFLNYDSEINKFILKDSSSKFIMTKDKKLFDITNRVFMKKNDKSSKDSFYIGDSNKENADIFQINNMASTLFKKVNYDEIQNEIILGNYIQVLLKDKESGEFLSVKANSNEAINQNISNSSYLNGEFNYNRASSDLSNFLFEIRPYTSSVTSFNLYSKVKGTSLNIGHGFLSNKLLFDKNNDTKVRFVIEKNQGKENEFLIKDDYGSYLSFDESDDNARVVSNGFLQKFLGGEEVLDTFEIYLVDFNTLENMNSGNYISFASKKGKSDIFLDKITTENTDVKNIDEYIVFKNKEPLFLTGDNLIQDMIITDDYEHLKGIEKKLISRRNGNYLGYMFRILNGINNTHNINFDIENR